MSTWLTEWKERERDREMDVDRQQGNKLKLARQESRVILSITKGKTVLVSTTCYISYPVKMVRGEFFVLGSRSSVCQSGEWFSSGTSFKAPPFYPPFPLSRQRTGRIVPRTKIVSSKKYPRDVLLPFLFSLSRLIVTLYREQFQLPPGRPCYESEK